MIIIFSKKKSEKNNIFSKEIIEINELGVEEINTKSSGINSEKKAIYNNDIKIGDFLLDFFKFYGFEFDNKHYGFSLNEKNFGQTFKKINGYQENSISVKSIEQEDIDIGIKCFNYDKIIDLFQRTYFKIKMERDNNIFSILNSLKFPSE